LAVAVGGGGSAIALVVRVIVPPRCTFTIFHYVCSPISFYLEPYSDGNAHHQFSESSSGEHFLPLLRYEKDRQPTNSPVAPTTQGLTPGYHFSVSEQNPDRKKTAMTHQRVQN
jgi:hypothetical protein